MKLFLGTDGQPLFSSNRVVTNFIVLVLCSQFAFSVLAMKGVLLPQMLELWQISKTQFGLLMSIYGIVHNVFYLALALSLIHISEPRDGLLSRMPSSA